MALSVFNWTVLFSRFLINIIIIIFFFFLQENQKKSHYQQIMYIIRNKITEKKSLGDIIVIISQPRLLNVELQSNNLHDNNQLQDYRLRS